MNPTSKYSSCQAGVLTPLRKISNRLAKAQLEKASEKTDDDFECGDAERRQQIDSMLNQLPMSPVEKQFVINTADKMVDLACDARPPRTARSGKRWSGIVRRIPR